MKSTVVFSSPDILGGTPVFIGTRVPVEALLDYLEGGDSIDEFIQAVYNYPTLADLYKYAAYDGLGNFEKRNKTE